MKIELTGETYGQFHRAKVTINPQTLKAVLAVASVEGSPIPYLVAALCSRQAQVGIKGFEQFSEDQKREIFQTLTEACTRSLAEKVEEFNLKYAPIEGVA